MKPFLALLGESKALSTASGGKRVLVGVPGASGSGPLGRPGMDRPGVAGDDDRTGRRVHFAPRHVVTGRLLPLLADTDTVTAAPSTRR